jgi:hypothetical protein
MPRNPLVVGRMRWGVPALAGSLVALFGVATGAQAVVVGAYTPGQSSVAYKPSGQSGSYGVALAPASASGLKARMQLLPQSLHGVLRSGIAVRVSASELTSGIADVLIARGTAQRLHVRVGPGPAVIIGRGTISTIKNGTVVLHLRLSRGTVAKLNTLSHLALTLKLRLVGVARDHLAIDAAGRY